MIGRILILGKNSKLTPVIVILLIGFIFFVIHEPSIRYNLNSSDLFFNLRHRYHVNGPKSVVSTTNISNIVFLISGSARTWRERGPYVDLWWRPNQTYGVVWLDQAPTEYAWPSASPPYRVSEDTTRFKEYDRHNNPSTIRAARMILETFKLEFEGVRWFVKADDDTLLILDNLVELLAKYDHNGYYYIGGGSESVVQNDKHSFRMAFGGGGFAISYPLAKALAKNIDGCLKRYPTLYGEDHVIMSCIAELGISVTRELGFHQIDLQGDISGFLSSHPQAPLVSLHHLDIIDPIIPSMSRLNSLEYLMEAVKMDSSRILQQIICYNQEYRWSVSISWGYSVHVYEELLPPSFLHVPLQTFRPWNDNPSFMFNVRPLSRDPCEMPHVYYLESVEVTKLNQIVTIYYIRRTPWELSSCGNHSVQSISKIKVFSPAANRLQWGGGRRDCCNIKHVLDTNAMEVVVRACRENEVLKWSHLS